MDNNEKDLLHLWNVKSASSGLQIYKDVGGVLVTKRRLDCNRRVSRREIEGLGRGRVRIGGRVIRDTRVRNRKGWNRCIAFTTV